MGTAIAKVFADNGHVVKLWNWEGDPAPLEEIAAHHENKTYLPGVSLPESIIATPSMVQALADVDVVVFAVPSGPMAATVKQASEHIKEGTPIVNVAKGMDVDSLQFMPQVIAANLASVCASKIVSVSGPAIAKQLANGQVTAMNIAGESKTVSYIREVMENDYLHLVPVEDMIGMHVGGAFKNVYAIALGICDGLGMSLNTKSIVLTAALKELSMIAQALGGDKGTVYGLAGIGDLIGTALADASRNRRFGEYLGSGMEQLDAIKYVGQVVEGIDALHIIHRLLTKHPDLSLPLAKNIHAIVHGSLTPQTGMKHILEQIV